MPTVSVLLRFALQVENICDTPLTIATLQNHINKTQYCLIVSVLLRLPFKMSPCEGVQNGMMITI